MSVHLFTVTIAGESGLPEDVFVNTFHFEGGGSDPENVGDMLDDFYNVVPTGQAVSIMSFIPSDAIGGTMTITGYDLADPIPRVPIYESVRTPVSPSSADQLPTEVALCLSFQAAPLSGVSQARRRNRVYLGPWRVSADSNGRPIGQLRNVMAASARDLLLASLASVTWSWIAYSPTSGVGAPVVNGWVDDAWDTQRRRGLAPTTRTLWSNVLP